MDPSWLIFILPPIADAFPRGSHRCVRQRERLCGALNARSFGWSVVRSSRPEYGATLAFGAHPCLELLWLSPEKFIVVVRYLPGVAACQSDDALRSLSAIMLDDDYYDILASEKAVAN